MFIELPSEPQNNLDWSKELAAARDSKEKIVWHFRLGLEQPYFPFEDELKFAALALALQQFTKDVFPEFADRTEAMCLYKGLIIDQPMYFQMLAHKLPDEVPIWLLFDVPEHLSTCDALRAITREGYEHFVLVLKGKDLPIEGYRWDGTYKQIETDIGAVFPLAPTERIDELLKQRVKIVFEPFLAEQWGGLNRLLVLDDSLSIQGKRMIQGFLAAGGEVTYI